MWGFDEIFECSVLIVPNSNWTNLWGVWVRPCTLRRSSAPSRTPSAPLCYHLVLGRYTLIWDLIYLPRHPLGKYDLLALTMVEMQFDHVSFPLALSCHHRESISLLSLGKRLVPLSFLTCNRGNTCQFFSRTLSWSSIPVSDKSKPKISAARNFFQWPPFSAVIFPIDLWWCGREGGPYSFLIGKRKAITLYQCIFPETFP